MCLGQNIGSFHNYNLVSPPRDKRTIVGMQEREKLCRFYPPTDTYKTYKCDDKTCYKRHPKNF